MSFEDKLRRLGPKALTVTHTIDNKTRIALSGTVAWSTVAILLAEHDYDCDFSNGVLTVYATTGKEKTTIMPSATTACEAGPIRTELYFEGNFNGTMLAKLAAQQNVLRVQLMSRGLRVDKVVASDIKDGLFHLQKRNRVQPRKPRSAPDAVFQKSAAAVAGKQRRASRRPWFASARSYLWGNGS